MKNPFFRASKKAGARVAIPTRRFWVLLAMVVLAIAAAGTLTVHAIVSTRLLRGWVKGSRSIWVEIYRFRGHARLTGGFTLRPHARAKIGPAPVEFLSGGFTLGPDQPILSSATGRSDCDIDAFETEAVKGQQVWSRISGNIRLDGRLDDIRFLNHFISPAPEPRLSGGGGKAHFDLRFDHGKARGGAEFELSRVAARYPKGTLRGRASGRLKVPAWDVEHNNMEISGSHIALSNVVTTGTAHDERDWWGRFDIPSGRIHNGLSAQTAVSCRDARPLYTLVGTPLPGWAEGILKLEGIKATARIRLASKLVDMENLEANGGKFHIAGRNREKGLDRHGAFLVETGILAVGVAVDGPSSRVKLLGARKWFAHESEGKASPASGKTNR